MREEVANLVYPVISYALDLKGRLDAGQTPNLETEQAALKGLLLTDIEAKRWMDFGGEMERDTLTMLERGATEEAAPSVQKFLGIRYALVCWLDELFILYSSWSTDWNEHKLEVALYRSNERAWKFWDQAQRAETRAGSDALEAFFLCVMLGFRGELREEPDRFRTWVAASQGRIAHSHTQEGPHPPELEPPTHVPPLRAREKFQRMVLLGGALVLLLIPVVAFVLVGYLSQ
jgi:type VI secretion system protein ImpK